MPWITIDTTPIKQETKQRLLRGVSNAVSRSIGISDKAMNLIVREHDFENFLFGNIEMKSVCWVTIYGPEISHDKKRAIIKNTVSEILSTTDITKQAVTVQIMESSLENINVGTQTRADYLKCRKEFENE